MKVLLVWPYGAFDGATLPLCYSYLIPLLRNKYEIEMLDCALHDIHPRSEEFAACIKRFNPDVVGVSAWTIHKDFATLTLQIVKSINASILTVAGGPHFTGAADYTLRTDAGIIDFVVKGEAEFSFDTLLEVLSKPGPSQEELQQVPGLCFIGADGSLHETPIKYHSCLDDFGQPDYSVIDLPGYLKKGYSYRSGVKMQAPILTTRGCPYTCDFCSAPYLNGRNIRKHSLSYMKDLIGSLYNDYGIRHFNIIDDNFTFDTHYAKDFCRMFIDDKYLYKGISFGTPNGIRIERTDRELFCLMRAVGWQELILAPESGSQKMVDRMSKHLNLEIFPEKVREIRETGIEVEAFFIIGHPGEDSATIEETKKFIREVKFDTVALHIFQPLQGTPIHNQLLLAGAIRNGNTITSYSEVNWVPENWTKEQLGEVIFALKKASIMIFPLRFEWIFSKFTKTGQLFRSMCGERIRHKLFMGTYRFRRSIWKFIFNLRNRGTLRWYIQASLDRESREEEPKQNETRKYESIIMEKSDELKQKYFFQE